MSESYSPKWIRFVEDTPPAWKTKYWRVESKHDDCFLGGIRWWGRWHRYSFLPEQDTIFEWDCLREIAGFCERQTTEHNQTLKEKHEQAK